MISASQPSRAAPALTSPPLSKVAPSVTPPPYRTCPTPKQAAATSSVPIGPATATLNSSPGVLVGRVIRVYPPNRARSIPDTPMPHRRAASA